MLEVRHQWRNDSNEQQKKSMTNQRMFESPLTWDAQLEILERSLWGSWSFWPRSVVYIRFVKWHQSIVSMINYPSSQVRNLISVKWTWETSLSKSLPSTDEKAPSFELWIFELSTSLGWKRLSNVSSWPHWPMRRLLPSSSQPHFSLDHNCLSTFSFWWSG